ncbi:TRAP transporter substrate-binding protein [Rhizobium puerariae]|uniref:TRAP transporter substrate-binding protein n=1 Tax=Rhizobium puerariae TaxID=1585791 RepID=A0ABV6AKU7_9HYPH
MRRRTFLSVLAAGTAASAMPARVFGQNQIIMKLGTSTLQDSQHQWMIDFAKIVDTKSESRIKVEIYPASQLGATPRMIEQTQMATIQGVVTPPEFLGGINEAYGILSAPGEFSDLEHTARTLSDPELNDFVFSLGESKGLKGLGLFISGPTAFCTRTLWKTPEEFSGAKVRVLAAKLQQEQIRALGGTPIPMPPSEILPALQQGTLDAVMSCIPVMEGLGFMDGAKYFLETNHGSISSFAAISMEWFEDLPSDLQEIIVTAGQEATQTVKQFSIDDVSDAKAQWTKKGGEIVPLSADERRKFLDTLLPVGPKIVAENSGMQSAYDIYKAAIERTR